MKIRCSGCGEIYSHEENKAEGYETISICPYCKTRNFYDRRID